MTQENIERTARICHEANRAYCESIGDMSQAPWNESQRWQRESAILGVQGSLEGNSPEQSHQSWLRQKLQDGWTWGPTKDVERKTHPCMVEYKDLPDEQRLKDEIFITIVSVMKGYLHEPDAAPA